MRNPAGRVNVLVASAGVSGSEVRTPAANGSAPHTAPTTNSIAKPNPRMPQCAVTAGGCQAGSRAKSILAGPAQKTNNTAKDVLLDGSDLTPLLTRTGKSLTQLKVLETSYNKLTDVKGLEKLT